MSISQKNGPATASEAPLVVVVEDEAPVRNALSSLFRSVGYRVTAYAAPHDLLAEGVPEDANCLVLDIRLPITSGLDLQKQLNDGQISIPIVFMTGHGDIQMSVQAMKAGAVDFLAKPFREQEMLDAVTAAIERDLQRREADAGLADLRRRLQSLTPREREILELATAGMMNKQIAAELSVSEVTVKIHRGRVMQKMEARSIADLVRYAEALGIRRQDGHQ
ncbi:response regulator [Pelagibius sp. 7325]|uniref:response regulator transcription factor n=1 Tax=Pelagibius sp. 7325 TaxID=3131994 RepID=UPI0030EDAFDF